MIAALLLLAAAPEPEWNCADPQDQATMNMCAHRDFQKADADLNAQWQATSAEMREDDRRIDRRYDKAPGHFETLLKAQRAWLTYRQEHCRGDSFKARGGSLSPLLFSTCMTTLTKARTRELKELTEVE